MHRPDRAGATHTALWQPLIDREVWVRAQARLSEERIRGKGVNSVYLLSGLLHCAACGAAMPRDVTDGMTSYKAQRGVPGKERCEECRRRVRADVVEPAVLAVIPEIADHPVCRRRVEEEGEALRGGHRRSRDRAREIDVALGECRAQITRLGGALGIGDAVAEGITARLAELNADMSRLECERAVIASGATEPSPAAERADEARSFAEVFARASHAERKTIVAFRVARVGCGPGTGTGADWSKAPRSAGGVTRPGNGSVGEPVPCFRCKGAYRIRFSMTSPPRAQIGVVASDCISAPASHLRGGGARKCRAVSWGRRRLRMRAAPGDPSSPHSSGCTGAASNLRRRTA